jgi:ABC-2 type transport system ATP-binding protein
MSNSVLEVDGLTKRYGQVVAVDAVSFDAARGKTVALLGANGAGKTTTMAMIMGLLLPSSGAIRVFGNDLAKDRYKLLQRMNFSSPYTDLPHRLTVKENLTVYARLYGLDRVGDRIAHLAETLEISEFLKRQTGKLSAGQKTRVALAKALINDPELLLLDEPSASLDPDTADWVRSFLERYTAETGATILLASHNMAEVERLCDEVHMMREGAIVDSGTPRGLIERYGRDNLEEVFLDIARGSGVAEDSPGGRAADIGAAAQ